MASTPPSSSASWSATPASTCTGTPAAPLVAWAQSRCELDGDHLGDGRRVVREVKAVAGAELDDRQERGRRDVSRLVVVADDADDLQVRESRAASASGWASLRALLRQLSGEEGDAPSFARDGGSRPDKLWFARLMLSPGSRARHACAPGVDAVVSVGDALQRQWLADRDRQGSVAGGRGEIGRSLVLGGGREVVAAEQPDGEVREEHGPESEVGSGLRVA